MALTTIDKIDSIDLALALTIATMNQDEEQVNQILEVMALIADDTSARWIFNLARKTTKSEWLDRRLEIHAR
jgi:hypothetical protein